MKVVVPKSSTGAGLEKEIKKSRKIVFCPMLLQAEKGDGIARARLQNMLNEFLLPSFIRLHLLLL